MPDDESAGPADETEARSVPADPDRGHLPAGQAWALTMALWLLVVSVVAYEIAPAAVLPLVRADLGVGPAAASWVVSALFLGMATTAIPVGVALDRVDNRHAVVVSAAGVLAMAAWGWRAGAAGAFAPLVASRFLAGTAVVAAWTASVNLVGDAFVADREATALGVLATAIPAGLAVGQAAGPRVAAAVGWPASLAAFAGVGLAVAVAFWLPTGGLGLGTGRGTPPTPAEFRRVLVRRDVWAVGVLAFVAFSLNLFFNNWLPSYVVDRFAVPVATAGLVAAAFPAIGVVSRASSGLVSDRLFDHRRRPVVLLSFLVTAPVVVVVAVADAVPLLLAGLAVAGFSTQVGLALLFPYVRELVPGNVVGTALAVLNAVGFLGAFSAPVVAGALIERSGYATAFGYAALLAVVGVAVSAWAPAVHPGGGGDPAG